MSPAGQADNCSDMMNLDESKYRGAGAWQKDAYSFVTGQFAKLDRSYRRHCGPTAITSLLYTLAQREGRPIKEKPEDVFKRIAQMGKKRLVYMNADFLKRFGGTSDLFAPFLIAACLRAYGLHEYKVRGPYLATANRICRELDRGAILYMEMHRHPIYGSHHMLCYGYRIVDGKLMLRTADGWITRIHELPAGQELFSLCTVIIRK